MPFDSHYYWSTRENDPALPEGHRGRHRAFAHMLGNSAFNTDNKFSEVYDCRVEDTSLPEGLRGVYRPVVRSRNPYAAWKDKWMRAYPFRPTNGFADRGRVLPFFGGLPSCCASLPGPTFGSFSGAVGPMPFELVLTGFAGDLASLNGTYFWDPRGPVLRVNAKDPTHAWQMTVSFDDNPDWTTPFTNRYGYCLRLSVSRYLGPIFPQFEQVCSIRSFIGILDKTVPSSWTDETARVPHDYRAVRQGAGTLAEYHRFLYQAQTADVKPAGSTVGNVYLKPALPCTPSQDLYLWEDWPETLQIRVSNVSGVNDFWESFEWVNRTYDMERVRFDRYYGEYTGTQGRVAEVVLNMRTNCGPPHGSFRMVAEHDDSGGRVAIPPLGFGDSGVLTFPGPPAYAARGDVIYETDVTPFATCTVEVLV